MFIISAGGTSMTPFFRAVLDDFSPGVWMQSRLEDKVIARFQRESALPHIIIRQ